MTAPLWLLLEPGPGKLGPQAGGARGEREPLSLRLTRGHAGNKGLAERLPIAQCFTAGATPTSGQTIHDPRDDPAKELHSLRRYIKPWASGS